MPRASWQPPVALAGWGAFVSSGDSKFWTLAAKSWTVSNGTFAGLSRKSTVYVNHVLGTGLALPCAMQQILDLSTGFSIALRSRVTAGAIRLAYNPLGGAVRLA